MQQYWALQPAVESIQAIETMNLLPYSNSKQVLKISLFEQNNWKYGWDLTGFGQLYYTNIIVEETIVKLYYTNVFGDLFMHACILDETKPYEKVRGDKTYPF